MDFGKQSHNTLTEFMNLHEDEYDNEVEKFFDLE
jgi:hypothetical protein